MNIGYVRVSTADQNEARQVEALKDKNIEKWFSEKISARDMERPQLHAMLDFAREGDSIYVEDFSRLARSTKDLLEIVERLQQKGIELISLKENLDTSTPTGRLMLTMIAAINEFERANIRERQAEGIALAKKAGAYKGRQRISVPDMDRHYQRYMNREISKAGLARELGISRPTMDRLIKECRDRRTDNNNR